MSQCNTCGANFSTDTIDKCSFCPTLVCSRCRRHHEPFCEEIQKLKRRGQGPTIANVPVPPHRRGHETPEPTPAPPPRVFIPEWGAPTMDQLPVYDVLTGKTSARVPLDAVLHQDNMPELTVEPPFPDALKDFVPYFLPETAEPTVMNPFGLIAPKVDVVSLEKLMPELTADEPEMYLGSDPIPVAEKPIHFFAPDIENGATDDITPLAGESYDDIPNSLGADSE